jgi:hypothetical protein
LIAYTLEKTMGKSHSMKKITTSSVIYTKEGAAGGTWAHPNIALAYAKYLSAALHYEVNEVFLRYRAGDARLADETLQRSSPEGNEWAGVRALSRAKRNEFTQTLNEHEVKLPPEYAQVTNATYQGLTGKTAAQLKAAKGLPRKANLRDAMPTQELVFVMAAEQLAKERIIEENALGVSQCSVAAMRSAINIKRAIEADRADRKPAIR